MEKKFSKTDEELKQMNDNDLFEYLDAKAAYLKQYKQRRLGISERVPNWKKWLFNTKVGIS